MWPLSCAGRRKPGFHSQTQHERVVISRLHEIDISLDIVAEILGGKIGTRLTAERHIPEAKLELGHKQWSGRENAA
jgi:hypothetical protein